MSDDVLSLCGKFLIAMPGMSDARFDRTVIYICAYSKDGAMGFVINQNLEEPTVPDFLKQLEIISEDEHGQISGIVNQKKLSVGGPVEPGRGFVLHSSEFVGPSTMKVANGVSLTATLEILRAIATGKGPEKYMIILGYSGWSAGQLEAEIRQNGWLSVDADNSIIFDTGIEKKYDQSLALLGVDPAALSSLTGNA